MDLTTVESPLEDEVFGPSCPSERNGVKNGPSPPSDLVRNSPSRLSSESRKGKFAEYFCGLKKKKSKEGNSVHSSTNGSGKKMSHSQSQFYCTPSPRSSPISDVDDDIPVTNTNAKVPPIGHNGLDGTEVEDQELTRNSFRNSSPAHSDVQAETEKLIESGDLDTDEGGEMGVDKRKSTSAFYTLTVHLIKGSDLVIKDSNGSSDPYVKVRIGEKTLYKSKVVNANLNPIWDETFTIPIHDINDPLIFKVVDYDWGSKDDFMGMCVTNLRKLSTSGEPEDLNLQLSKKGVPGEKSMGELSVSMVLTPRTSEEQHLLMTESVTSQAQKKMQKQTWNGMLNVLLIDVQDLPFRRNSVVTEGGNSGSVPGYSNVFAKLRLGNQKRRSKQITEITDRPEWMEQFDFYLFEANGQSTVFEMDFLEEASTGRNTLGSVCLDICHLEKEKTAEYFLNFSNGLGRARVAITLSGFRPTSSDNAAYPSKEFLTSKYSLRETLKLEALRDVGHLTVKVIQAEGLRAADIGGKSDPFCVLELINARVQTHTEYKTLTPTWNKTFHFEVRDITSKLEVTVYDEDRDHRRDFLGKLNIPLWKIVNGEQVWYKLRNRNLAKGARGNNPQILLEMDLVWNPIRAAIRVTDPQEVKYVQPKPQLKIETFLVNMERLRLVLMDVYDIWLYIKSCLDWEYPERSIKALTFYLLTCYFFQPFFIPLYFLIYWLKPWWRKFTSSASVTSTPTTNSSTTPSIRKTSRANLVVTVSASTEDTLNLEESDDDEEGGIKKLSLIEKFTILQDASGVLQELVGEVAAICESTVNTYRMVVPFIYWLFALFFAASTIIFLVIDYRYVAMLFGIHEFSRIYLRPWKQSTFEVYHMIRRVPHQMNLGDKLGINSVLKSIQQLKYSTSKKKFWKRPKSSSPTPSSAAATSWYVQQEVVGGQ